MSLSAREQQALDGIANGLAGSDPVLVTRLAMFTRLTSGGEMPAREMVGTTRRAWGDVRRLYRRLGFPRVAPLVWLLIAVTLIAVALAVSGGRETCAKSRPAACAGPVSAHLLHPAHPAG